MARKLKCPLCGKEISWEGNPYRPFCSKRCKWIDLGHWLSEEYRIALPKEALEDEKEEDHGEI